MGVGSNPTRATPESVVRSLRERIGDIRSRSERTTFNAFGRAVGRQAVCKTAALSGNVGSIPTQGTLEVRSAECGVQNKDRFVLRTPHSALRTPNSALGNGDVAQLAEAAVSGTVLCGFESHRHHCSRIADGPAPVRVS